MSIRRAITATRLKGFDASEIESFIDQLIDWVDPDNQPLNFGAENYFCIS